MEPGALASTLEQLERYRASAKAPALSYIVIDPMQMPNVVIHDVDGVGRRYLRASPAFLNDGRFVKGDECSELQRATGIQVYRLEDMRADWPSYGVEG